MDRKVLIVDDDANVRQALLLVLQPVCDALEASNGLDALRLIKKWKPDLVLLDVSMPEMGGLGILRAALERDPALAVVMLSGHGDLRVARRALEEGARAYMTKPFDAHELRDEVARLLDAMSAPPASGRPWRVAAC